jgi:hypothetical protein
MIRARTGRHQPVRSAAKRRVAASLDGNPAPVPLKELLSRTAGGSSVRHVRRRAAPGLSGRRVGTPEPDYAMFPQCFRNITAMQCKAAQTLQAFDDHLRF